MFEQSQLKQYLNILLTCTLLLTARTVFSAEIWSKIDKGVSDDALNKIDGRNGRIYLYIRGTIEKGDYNKFVSEIKRLNHFPDNLELNSSGGDVLEAIKIGKLAREALLYSTVTGQCSSACFLILSGSVSRIVWPDKKSFVGIHRPRYDNSYFANLSPSEAAIEYRRLDGVVRTYLINMDIPTHIIDTMMSTPSDRLQRWNDEETEKNIGTKPPAYYEWLTAKCGSLTKTEETDWVTSIYNRAKQKQQPFSKGYIDYLDNKKMTRISCELEALEIHRKNAMKHIK